MDLIGRTVGHYRVVSLLGHGGMGDVYSGFDETLQRRVALKSIRGEFRMDPDAKRRFLREAQTLSRLDHPHICRIHDLVEGADSDLLVLELIEGTGLRQALAEGLSRPRAMRAAQQIASALVAAHGKGIVHRDLKPDNVMLTREGDAKVLDFGLSRSIENEIGREVTVDLRARPSAADPTTDLTPRPASEPTTDLTPRPAAGDATEDLAPRPGKDEATEGLQGRGPSVDSRAATAEPLSRAGSIMGTLGYMSPEQARGEIVTPASDLYALGLILQELFTGKRALPGELSGEERLAMAARGESLPAEGLDPDLTALIGRLKSFEPSARPTALDTLERLRWIEEAPKRRRRRVATASALVFLAAVAVTMTFMAFRIRREADRANREAESSKQVSEFLVGLFEKADPFQARGAKVTVREVLDRGSGRVKTELASQPLVQAKLQRTLGQAYEGLGLYAEAETLFRAASETDERLLPPGDLETCWSLTNLGSVLVSLGRTDEGEPVAKRAMALCEASLGPENRLVLLNLSNLATAALYAGRDEEAESLQRRALALAEKIGGPGGADTAMALNNLASILSYRGQSRECEALYRRSLAIDEKLYGTDHPSVAMDLFNLGSTLCDLGRPDEGEPILRRALDMRERVLGPEHPGVAAVLTSLAIVAFNRGQVETAVPLLERALAINEKALGPGHARTALGYNNLGGIYMELGQYAKAKALFEQAYANRVSALGPDHPSVSDCIYSLGVLDLRQRRYTQALPQLREALRRQERDLGADHPDVALTLADIGRTLNGLGQTAEAQASLARSLAIWDKARGREHPEAINVVVTQAEVAAEAGQREAALERLKEALDRGLEDPSALKRAAFKRLGADPGFQKLEAAVAAKAAERK